jgi:hypothetical protein
VLPLQKKEIFIKIKGMKRVLLLAFCCLALLGCEPKPEQQYNELLGDWYLYAAYKEGSDTDLLPMAEFVGFGCMKTSVLHVTEGEFILDSDCDWLACSGTYVQEESVIQGVKTNGEKVVFYFKQGVLSTIKNIPTNGNVEMRFQKLEENIQ